MWQWWCKWYRLWDGLAASGQWTVMLRFISPIQLTAHCARVSKQGSCVWGSCSPHHVHLQHPCDYHRHLGASKTQVTYICYLGQALGYIEDRQASQLPGPLRSAWGPYLLCANSSCGLCCRPVWSWCVVVWMNVAITYIFKSFSFYVFLKFCLNIKQKAVVDKSAPGVDIVLYNCIY